MGKVYDGEIRHRGGEHYPRLNPSIQDGWNCSRKMSTLLQNKNLDYGLVDFSSIGGADLDGAGEMRSPYRSKTRAITYIMFFIYAQLHLYMENMS